MYRDIYSGHFWKFFVQIKKQWRIWRRTSWKEEGKRGKKKKKGKSDKIPLCSLNDRQKSTKKGKNFRGGGIFLLARIYTPVSILSKTNYSIATLLFKDMSENMSEDMSGWGLSYKDVPASNNGIIILKVPEDRVVGLLQVDASPVQVQQQLLASIQKRLWVGRQISSLNYF